MRKLHKGLIWFAVLALVSSSPAWAGSAYSTTTTTGSVLGNGPFTLGSAFTVGATDISVDKLGVFQSADTGVLLEAHDVGIWDAGGKLIAKATVAAGAADPLVDKFRYHDLAAAVTLLAGQTYAIGATWNNLLDPLLFPGQVNGFMVDPSIKFVEDRFVAGGFGNPVNTDGSGLPAYFGPNFNIQQVPEPATLTLLGLGIAGMAGYGWRRRKPTVA